MKYDEQRDYQNILNSIIGEKWQSFYEERKEEYKIALNNSMTYVIYDEKYCGYLRAITDKVFTIFIAEIIVEKDSRNKGYGKKLIEYVQNLFPSARIDLISDEDEFYQKIGFRNLGNGMRRHNWY